MRCRAPVLPTVIGALMSHTEELIETTLRVSIADESTAVKVAEILARVLVSLSADGLTPVLDVERFTQHCHHPDHDEDEVAP